MFSPSTNFLNPSPFTDHNKVNRQSRPIDRTKIAHLTGTNPISHNSENQSFCIPEKRKKSINGCFGSSGVTQSLTNNYSNMAKDMVRTKNFNPPQVLFDRAVTKKDVWSVKQRAQWTEPKGQKLTLQ
mmetsp:Transcript_5585/g.8803  ORF Transcript_5585/g.8803 Transcript_5585/m.8803 type:complete len:127 (-) Transcript_5585:23-403(-)